eukprot:365904-Chlamydomonas_euryale.AAC.11
MRMWGASWPSVSVARLQVGLLACPFPLFLTVLLACPFPLFSLSYLPRPTPPPSLHTPHPPCFPSDLQFVLSPSSSPPHLSCPPDLSGPVLCAAPLAVRPLSLCGPVICQALLSAITALCMYDREDVDAAAANPGDYPNIDLLQRVYSEGLEFEFKRLVLRARGSLAAVAGAGCDPIAVRGTGPLRLRLRLRHRSPAPPSIHHMSKRAIACATDDIAAVRRGCLPTRCIDAQGGRSVRI